MRREDTVKFCILCGGNLKRVEERFLRFRCLKCNEILYLNPKVCVAILIEVSGRVLLVRRRDEPFSKTWTLPSGFVEYEESCEEAALREAKEEIGAQVSLTGIHGVFSFKDDPRSNMVLIVYLARCEATAFSPGSDVDLVQFFPLSDLPLDIAFSSIRQALQQYLKQTSAN